MLTNYLPVVVMLVVAVGFGLALLLAALYVGPHRPSPQKDIPYESGLDPAGAPRMRFHARFYRIALLFLVFDIEAAFFYPWAVMYRDLNKDKLGNVTPFGLLVMVVFLAVLLLALVFVWRKKALEWD